MHQQEEERTEKALAKGLGGGAAAFALGFVVLLFGMIIGLIPLMILGPLLIVGGLASMGMSLYAGINREKGQFEGPQRTYTDVKIISRAAYDDQARLVSTTWDVTDEEEDEIRYYVKIELETGNKIEFECARETYYSCGEGSRGDALTQGKWLSQYITRIEAGRSSAY